MGLSSETKAALKLGSVQGALLLGISMGGIATNCNSEAHLSTVPLPPAKAMNRTLLSEANQQVLPSPGTSRFESQEFAFPAEPSFATTAHSCFAPMHYEAGYAYPLIVWLHGPQSNEDELSRVMPLISMRNQVAIAPRGTRAVEGIQGGYGWGDSVDDIAEAGKRVQDCIEIAQQQYNIKSDRVFLAGHSTGGTMAHRLGLEYPNLFAGAISLGGPVPRGSRLLKNINQARRLPLLLSVSPNEENYATKQVMDDMRFLHSAGISLSLRLYPEGDELTTTMFSDLNSWVMEQFCVTNATPAS